MKIQWKHLKEDSWVHHNMEVGEEEDLDILILDGLMEDSCLELILDVNNKILKEDFHDMEDKAIILIWEVSHMEDSLKELGFEIVIQYNGNAPLNYDSEKLQLYYVMACGTRDSNYYTVQHAVTGRNCSLITIGFSDPREYYSADDLIEDLNYFAECEMNDEITVTNTADAYAAQRSYDEEYEETAAYTAVRSAEIAARVQELRSELSELTKLGEGHNP